MIRVTVWSENFHESVRKQENVLAHYPNGIHSCIADFLKEEFTVRTATLYNAQGERNENAGLTKELLEEGASVSKAAMECGFSDLSYFTKVFKRQYGVLPSKVRI